MLLSRLPPLTAIASHISVNILENSFQCYNSSFVTSEQNELRLQMALVQSATFSAVIRFNLMWEFSWRWF